jgi:hypothetical protein
MDWLQQQFPRSFMGNSWFVVGGRKPLEYVSMEKV